VTAIGVVIALMIQVVIAGLISWLVIASS